MITTTLNSGAPSSLPVSTVLDELGKLLPRYVVLPKHAAETLALWIVHTYCFQFRDVSTYLGIESPVKRCGKTTLLGVLGKLVNRPVVASNISPSAFFRVIEEMKPTLLIDEADTFLDGNDELRGILNAGYHEPNAYVLRVRPDVAHHTLDTSHLILQSRPQECWKHITDFLASHADVDQPALARATIIPSA